MGIGNRESGIGDRGSALCTLHSALMTAALLAAPVLTLAGQDSSAFRFQPQRALAGVALHYLKSNVDGSHQTNLSVCFAASDRLESFKWRAGDSTATLVKAEVDWRTFSIRRFESRQVCGTKDSIYTTLVALEGGGEVVVRFAGREWTVAVRQWPWHSYDFDLASLGATMPHLVHPEAAFEIGIMDVEFGPGGGPNVKDKGAVQVVYLGGERHNGRPTRRYGIDGPGLEQQGGLLWTDLAGGYITDYEIALPDEPGMKSRKLTLRAVEWMTPAAWAEFRRSRLAR